MASSINQGICKEVAMIDVPVSRMVLAVSLGLGCAAIAACNSQAGGDAVKYADVTRVEPVTKTVNTPRQVCDEVQVQHVGDPKDKHEIAGTALGAVVGGVLGNQVGSGDGKKLATVAGAVAGGYAGKRIQEAHQHPEVTTTTEPRCRTVTDSHAEVVGYDVTYVYDGVTGHTRMTQKPGERIPVRQGLVVADGQG
jgi:uncharacterized protein YcfJ